MPRRSLLLRLLVAQLAFALVLGDSAAHRDRRAFFSSAIREPKPVDHPIIQDAAKFAVGELQKLSDSTIYTTLQLAHIHSAAAEVGDFHYAVHLRVSLASPYFQSGNATEQFELMVLESKDLPGKRPKHERSIAIDEFPVMDENAIEEFWIRMVNERRRKRAALFDSWRREAQTGIDPVVAAAAETVMEMQGIPPREKIVVTTKPTQAIETIRESMSTPTTKKKKKTLALEDLEAMSTKQLRKLLSASAAVTEELREAIAEIVDARLDRLEQQEKATGGVRDEL